MKIRYFDHSATTPVDEEVFSRMMPYFSKEYGNPSSLYDLGKNNKEAINISRMKIANILNADVNEIYFTSCGSESDNMILKGIAFANSSRGNHIITSAIEHPAILNTCKFLERFGFRITYLYPKSNGIIDPEDVRRAITRNTILISIMYANNEIGTIQPIEQIGKIAHNNRIYFHTDAVQVVGMLNIDVKKLNVDAMSMSSHKFYGPKGVGVVYISDKVNFIRIQDGGHQEKDKRAGTENVPGIVGTAYALEKASEKRLMNNIRLSQMRDFYFKEVLNRIPRIKINGDIENRLSSNANISFAGIDGNELVESLNKEGICTSSGSACSAGFINPSHVLLAIGLSKSMAKSSLRVTFGKDNSMEDTRYLVDKVVEKVENLRKK